MLIFQIAIFVCFPIGPVVRGRHEKKFGRNPEPTGTHFLEPIFSKLGWVPPGTPEPMGSWVPHMPTPDFELHLKLKKNFLYLITLLSAQI